MRKQLLVLACLLGVSSFAQQRDSLPGGGGARVTMTMPPGGMGGGAGMRQGPRPYKEIITEKAVTKKGLFTVHKVEDIPVSAWDAITRLKERHADLESHNMEVERTGKGEKVETGTGMGKNFKPFHAWLGEQNSGRDTILRKG